MIYELQTAESATYHYNLFFHNLCNLMNNKTFGREKSCKKRHEKKRYESLAALS